MRSLPKSSVSDPVEFPPPLAGAGVLGVLSSVGLDPFHLCVGPNSPSSSPSRETPPVVLLLLVTVMFLSSQYIFLFSSAGAIELIESPFGFNSASSIGTLVLPLKLVIFTVVFVLPETGLPKPSLPFQGITIFPAG